MRLLLASMTINVTSSELGRVSGLVIVDYDDYRWLRTENKTKQNNNIIRLCGNMSYIENDI